MSWANGLSVFYWRAGRVGRSGKVGLNGEKGITRRRKREKSDIGKEPTLPVGRITPKGPGLMYSSPFPRDTVSEEGRSRPTARRITFTRKRREVGCRKILPEGD